MPRGRSLELIEKRNKRLIERYYYWSEVKRRRLDDVFIILSQQEFFIHERTILEILRKNNDYLNSLISNKNTSSQLTLFHEERS